MEPTLWRQKFKLLPLREGWPVITGQKRTEMLWYIFTKKQTKYGKANYRTVIYK